MAQKIAKQYSVEHIVKGLQVALEKNKELASMTQDNARFFERIKQITSEINQLKNLPGGKASEALIKTYEKQLSAIFKQTGQDAFSLVEGLGEVSKKQLQENKKILDDLNDSLDELDKKERKIDKKFQTQEDGTFAPSRTGTLYKENIAPEVSKEMAGEEFVNPFSGKVVTDTANYVKQVEKIQELLISADPEKAKKVLDKIKKGEKLNKSELKFLNDTAKAKNEIKIKGDELERQLRTTSQLKQKEQEITKKLYDEAVSGIEEEREELKKKKRNYLEGREDLEKAMQDQNSLTDEAIEKNRILTKIEQESRLGNSKLTEAQKERIRSQKEANKTTKTSTKTIKENTTTLGKAAQQVFNYGLAFTALRRIYTETLSTIKDLDEALTEMSIVTAMNREESWELVGVMQDLAKETGFTTTEIAKLATVYFRQGRTLGEVIELTRVAAKAARVAGISAGESADFLTSAVNAFRLSADEALSVSDRFAALAASSASSYEELAVGLSKFAAQANVAGIGIDFAMGMLAKGVETTREAPETIGTAIKSVTARMRELSDLGKTFEDGMDINRVETALKQVGVQLRDSSGQFRNLENVLTDVGMRWESLNKNQQASVAVALAGIRQQSRLISIMNDFERTQELVQISTESAGATTAQHTEFMKGMEAATVQLRTAYQQFITTITNSEVIIGIIRGLAKTIETAANTLKSLGASGKNAMILIAGFAATLKTYSVIQSISNSNTATGVFLQKLFGNTLKINNATLKKITLAKIKDAAATKLSSIAQIFFTKATAGSTKGLVIFGKTLLLTPLGWIAAGLAGIVALFALFNKGANDSKKGVNSFASDFTGFVKSIGRVLSGLVEVVLGMFRGLLGLIKHWKILLFIFKAPVFIKFYLLLKGIQVVMNLISTVLNALVVALTDATIKIQKFIERSSFLSGVFEGIGNAVSWVSNKINDIVGVTAEWRKATEKQLDLQREYADLAGDLSEVRNESAAENFELSKKNRAIEDLIKEYNELNRIREAGLEGEEELQRRRDLESELENLDQGKFIKADTLTGQINFEETFKNLEEEREKNKEEIRNNLRLTAEEAVILAEKDINKFIEDQGGALTDVQNYLLNLVDEETTDRQKELLKEYYASLIESSNGVDLEALANVEYSSLIEQMENFDQALVENEDGLAGVRREYLRVVGALENNPIQLEAFKNLNADLDALLERLEGLSESQIDIISPVLDFIGYSPESVNQLLSILDNTEMSLQGFLENVGNLAERFENRGIAEGASAIAMAINAIASEQEDATVAADLFGLAMKSTILDTVQAADLLSSRIANLSDRQAEFLEGNLSSQDLFDLTESYPELFANEDFLNAFRTGGDLSRFFTQDLANQFGDFREQLDSVNQQIIRYQNNIEDGNQEELNGLIAQRNRLLLLMEYNGELRGLTKSQYAANKALESFNILNEMGIESLSARSALIQNLASNIGPVLSEADSKIKSIEETIQEQIGDRSLNSIYEIVDGVVVLKEAFSDLEPEIQQTVEAQTNLLDTQLESVRSYYKELMDQTIAYEEELAKEKIKVYEDYFKSLDRLESRRDMQMDRESIIEQISRLQGATDEASRKRALSLQQELNKLNEKSEEQIVKEARESLIDSVNQSVENLKNTFKSIFTDWISSGETTGEALWTTLKEYGLVDANGWKAPSLIIEPNVTPDPELDGGTVDNNLETPDLTGDDPLVPDIPFEPAPGGSGSGGGRFQLEEVGGVSGPTGFSKGGIVDYTGLAMLHGSKTRPEAVLNPNQTEIFKRIPEMMEKLASNSNSISIENISISTESLNTNQDFASAGETLAKAFKNAIQRKGVTINTKR